MHPIIRQPLLGLLLLIPFAALGQVANNACRADAERFCPNKNGAMECLLDHQQEVSDACYDALKQAMNRKRDFAACKEDAREYCRGVQPGGGRIVQCLLDHQKELSDACYDTLAKAKSAR